MDHPWSQGIQITEDPLYFVRVFQGTKKSGVNTLQDVKAHSLAICVGNGDKQNQSLLNLMMIWYCPEAIP